MARKRPIPADLKREEVLALDIAEHTGFYSTHGGGTWTFTESKSRNDNKKHKHFRDTLIKFIEKNNIRFVTAEDILMNKMRFRATVSLSELRGILYEVCDTMNLPEPEFINATTIKSFATGRGNAPKEEMVEACIKKYNITPVTDDHADAVFIFNYFCRRFKVR